MMPKHPQGSLGTIPILLEGVSGHIHQPKWIEAGTQAVLLHKGTVEGQDGHRQAMPVVEQIHSAMPILLGVHVDMPLHHQWYGMG
jgi:hypothetical protein